MGKNHRVKEGDYITTENGSYEVKSRGFQPIHPEDIFEFEVLKSRGEKMKTPTNNFDRIGDWCNFSAYMVDKFLAGPVKKYGAGGMFNDLLHYTGMRVCSWNILKYALRLWSGSGKIKDFEKIAHYAQIAWTLKEELGLEPPFFKAEDPDGEFYITRPNSTGKHYIEIEVDDMNKKMEVILEELLSRSTKVDCDFFNLGIDDTAKKEKELEEHLNEEIKKAELENDRAVKCAEELQKAFEEKMAKENGSGYSVDDPYIIQIEDNGAIDTCKIPVGVRYVRAVILAE